MTRKGRTHDYCVVCKVWKHTDEMISIDVCIKCFETHDKYGNEREVSDD